MTGIASITATSQLRAQGSGGAGASHGAAFSSSLTGASASGDTTTVSINADGSTTTTVSNAKGEVISSSTTAPENQASIASRFALQANKDELAKLQPASLINTIA